MIEYSIKKERGIQYMVKKFENIISKFKKINEMGYIKGVNNNILNSCGLTFEKLLNKKADSMYFPDYENIEIKCKQRFSRYDISLFSLSFDGPELFESNYLLEHYGIKNKDFNNKKELFINFKYNKKVLVNDKYYFELDIDEENKRILINIYDLNYRLIEKRGFIDFDTINTRVNVKIKNLALIYASKKKQDDELYFRYYKIICLSYKNFETFLKLIKRDIIKISLILRFSKSGKDIGKNKNKNMVFKICDKNIEELYDKVYFYEN